MINWLKVSKYQAYLQTLVLAWHARMFEDKFIVWLGMGVGKIFVVSSKYLLVGPIAPYWVEGYPSF